MLTRAICSKINVDITVTYSSFSSSTCSMVITRSIIGTYKNCKKKLKKDVFCFFEKAQVVFCSLKTYYFYPMKTWLTLFPCSVSVIRVIKSVLVQGEYSVTITKLGRHGIWIKIRGCQPQNLY